MLAGHRVMLRPFRRSDLEGLYELVSDVREVGEFWPLGCISEPRWLKQFEETHWWEPEFKIFLITDLEGRRIGQVVVYKASHSYQGWELGYRIYRPEDRGKGFMSEAVRLATAYLFAQEPIARIQLVIDPRNAASQAVAERTGFQLEGTLRHAHFNHGVYNDLRMYSILRSDVPQLQDLLAPLSD